MAKVTKAQAADQNSKALILSVKEGSTTVSALIAKLKEELAAIEVVTGSGYKTSGKIDMGFPNLDQIKDLGELIKAQSAIRAKAHWYNDTTGLYPGQQVPVFRHNGGTEDEWNSDFTLRYAIITKEERKNKLKESIEKLSKYVSEEERFQNDLESIASLFANS